MAQTASKKWLGIGLVVVVLFVALFLWNKHRQSGSNELVIGISPPFAKPLQA
ncbi:MetQ/NlpA family ABC transporter substrate-binding protein, partial [Acinetobacter baumannii]|nr:methionine transporter [Acinetobacter baumannii]